MKIILKLPRPATLGDFETHLSPIDSIHMLMKKLIRLMHKRHWQQQIDCVCKSWINVLCQERERVYLARSALYQRSWENGFLTWWDGFFGEIFADFLDIRELVELDDDKEDSVFCLLYLLAFMLNYANLTRLNQKQSSLLIWNLSYPYTNFISW